MKKHLFIPFIILFVGTLKSQEDTINNHVRFHAEIGSGIMTYLGALNNQKVIFNANNNFAYRGGLRVDYKRIGTFLYYNTGKYCENQNIVANNVNFLSKYSGGGIDVRFYSVKQKQYDVFVSTGVNYISAKFYTDIFDANGKPYYYWNDGTIRNQSQNYQNTFTSAQTRRDYTYETALGKKSFLFIPVGVGIELRLAERFKLGFLSQYYISFSNNINSVKSSSKKETLLYNSVSLSYVFIKIKTKEKEDDRYAGVDFNALMEEDTDGDGVKDKADNCMGTAKGIKVDKHGCPLDADDDGIIDVKDKEVHSKHNNYNDLNGYELTPSNLKDIKTQDMEDEALFSKMTEEEQQAEIERRQKENDAKTDKQYENTHPPATVDLDKDKNTPKH